ncbi:hypothetical protein JDV02_010024 [Purpureocillium takamizusanense]|uniref:Uncharacterized protein n=1 Tax=Purpureocillium takamizusanense TaxID=2060973 RepID=A0A9Q8VG87_9HYPO|nr:uncharacterized protein JDV02_010024 [Purpureocillium takamizusanense]UNI24261.1 hypothetical protein JDV02_010024 [Purpureocillium takamizusanense]
MGGPMNRGSRHRPSSLAGHPPPTAARVQGVQMSRTRIPRSHVHKAAALIVDEDCHSRRHANRLVSHAISGGRIRAAGSPPARGVASASHNGTTNTSEPTPLPLSMHW